MCSLFRWLSVNTTLLALGVTAATAIGITLLSPASTQTAVISKIGVLRTLSVRPIDVLEKLNKTLID